MKTKQETREYRAPALEKGLEILEHLADENQPKSRTEIAKGLGRAPAELFRMLTCLEQRGYVLRDADSGKYRLSLRLYEMGIRADPVRLLREAARQPMEQLAETVGQSCHLSVRHGDQLVVLMEWLPAKKICLAVGIGTFLPLLRTNSGKLILSGLSEEELDVFLTGDDSGRTISKSQRKDFLNELEQIRRDGFVVAPSGISGGVRDYAIPVGIPGTDTAAVIAVSQVCSSDAVGDSDCLAGLRHAAQEIHRRMGILR